jgi:hypothetical protein
MNVKGEEMYMCELIVMTPASLCVVIVRVFSAAGMRYIFLIQVQLPANLNQAASTLVKGKAIPL